MNARIALALRQVVRLRFWFIALALSLAAPLAAQAAAQDQQIDAQRQQAAELLRQGKVKQAIALIRSALPSAPNGMRVRLQFDLLELCREAFDWDCVTSTLADLPASQSLGPLFLQRLVYETEVLSLANEDLSETITLIDAYNLNDNPALANPGAVAKLQLLLHDYYLRRGDLAAAEHALSGSIANLLFVPTADSFARIEILVEIIRALVESRS